MQVIKLAAEEQRKTGCNHLAIIDYTDLNATAGTTKVLEIFPDGLARDIIDKVLVDLVTPFDGTSTTSLLLDVGYDLAAGTDDPDAFIDAMELHNDATELLGDAGSVAAPATDTVDETYSTAESTVIASLRTTINLLRAKLRWTAQEAYDLEALFTAVTANLTDLSTGRVRIYFNVIRLTELRNINGL
jgi:hypothetical protein